MEDAGDAALSLMIGMFAAVAGLLVADYFVWTGGGLVQRVII